MRIHDANWRFSKSSWGDGSNHPGIHEELGLIEPEERIGGGFRLYSDAQLRRLKIIQSLKELGFDLERIRDLFLLKTQRATGGELATSLIEHLQCQQEEIGARILHYQKMMQRNDKAIENSQRVPVL